MNLVEVESKTALEHFDDNFLNASNYEPELVKGKDTFAGQDVGMLTRIDPDGFDRTDRDGTSGGVDKSVSKNYFATFDDINGRQVAVIGLQFLSQPDNQSPRDQRQAQADAMRDQAVDLANDGHAIVMLGDFNDYDGDTLNHICSTPITNVLSTAREMSLSTPADDLVNVASLIPKSDRYTAHWDKDRGGDVDFPHKLTSIDHILVSPNLAGHIESVAIPKNHDPRSVTGHFAVVVTFNFGSGQSDTIGIGLHALLPNPFGDENQDEAITLLNRSQSDLDLTGWTIRDQANRIWALGGTITAGSTTTITRDGQAMALNNGGDLIHLLDPSSNVFDEFEYFETTEGAVIQIQ